MLCVHIDCPDKNKEAVCFFLSTEDSSIMNAVECWLVKIT